MAIRNIEKDTKDKDTDSSDVDLIGFCKGEMADTCGHSTLMNSQILLSFAFGIDAHIVGSKFRLTCIILAKLLIKLNNFTARRTF